MDHRHALEGRAVKVTLYGGPADKQIVDVADNEAIIYFQMAPKFKIHDPETPVDFNIFPAPSMYRRPNSHSTYATWVRPFNPEDDITRDDQGERDRRTVQEIKLLINRIDSAERHLNQIKGDLHKLAMEVRRV
jgi:hypothetical protein